MNTVDSEIRKLIKNIYFLNINNQEIKIVEKDKKAKLKELVITNIPKESIALKLENDDGFSHIINSGHPQANKCCDFVLISPRQNDVRILLGELKSERPKIKQANSQLKNTFLFITYIFSMLKEYHGITLIKKPRPIIFSKYGNDLTPNVRMLAFEETDNEFWGYAPTYRFDVGKSKVKIDYFDYFQL